MKKLFLSISILFAVSCYSQKSTVDYKKIKEDLHEIINDISQNYSYLNEKNISLDCIRDYYSNQIKNIKTEEETVLFFEYLMNEFYDSHLNLKTHRSSSYRLYSSVYASIENGKPIISNVWRTQIKNLKQHIIGAEILKFNGINFQEMIDNFPTYCNNKNNPETKEWITNKILAGRYNEPRNLTLKLTNNKEIDFDLDKIKLQKNDDLLTSKIVDNIAIIKINNSLGNDNLVNEFDKILDDLSNTKGLIIDLRNTVNGGDSYEARGIMSRFISEKKPYQQHRFIEKSKGNPNIIRSWIEYVVPRGKTYKKPVVILVGRWTGSMGEGLAIGFEGMQRGEIVGTKMRRLAGEVFDFNFKHKNYGYKLSAVKLFHINGTIREKYIPTNYVKQSTIKKDEVLQKGLKIIQNQIHKTNSILKEELEQLKTEDQTLRLLLPNIIEKFGRKSNEYKYVWTLIQKQDSITSHKLVTIINNYGWLGKNRVGSNANQAIWLTIQHSDLETQEKYLPLLKASVKKGESEGWHLAFLEDRILMRNKKKQIYGTQAVWDNNLKANKIYPIRGLENVNRRRKQLGLETIEEYANSNGYIFNQKK